MKKLLKIGLTTGALLFGFFVFAQINPFDIQFPIPELGSCGSMEECKLYCDIPENQEACFNWARAKGFVEEEPRPHIPNEGGPGGCQEKEECDAYCNQPEHNEECFNFGVEHGMISSEEAVRIKEQMNKTGPGGCQSREECDVFCRSPDNQAICLQFVVDEGRITQEEADYLIERMKSHEMEPHDMGPRPKDPDIDEDKIIELMNSGDFVGPGGCITMEECDTYCSQPENDEECFAVALEYGLIPPEEIEKFKRISEIGGPGGCHGPTECDAYCSQSEHQEECLQFAIENSLMPPEEIEHVKKMMELDKIGGPGGCHGREECDAYCSQPEHGEECFQFAKTNGLIPQEEIQMMEREMEIIRKLDQGDMGGPGGCQNREECDAFCRNPENMEECMKFSGDQGIRDPIEMERKMEEFRQMQNMIMQIGTLPSGDGGFYPSEGTNIVLRRASSGMFVLVIVSPNGIKEFSFTPQQGGLPYSGGLVGCPKEYKTETSFFASGFPFDAYVINCQDEKSEFIIDKEGEFNDFGSSGSSVPYPVLPDANMPYPSLDDTMYQDKVIPPEIEPCDFNNDGIVDDFENQKCKNMPPKDYEKPDTHMLFPNPQEEYQSFKDPSEDFIFKPPEEVAPTEYESFSPPSEEFIPNKNELQREEIEFVEPVSLEPTEAALMLINSQLNGREK